MLVSHFYLGINMMLIGLTLHVVNIHWVLMGGQLILYQIAVLPDVGERSNKVASDFFVVCIFTIIITFYTIF
jgi:hypothetical protein